MNAYTGQVPDTEPARKWLTQAACHGHADEMFPGDVAKDIANAKRICANCPVWRECLQDALDNGDNQHGIRGGMCPKERRALAKRRATGNTVVIQRPKVTKPSEPRPKTLAEAVRRRTVPTDNGHLVWDGVTRVRFEGRKYTAWQAAFVVGHGREPQGPVRRTCDVDGCVHRDHLADEVIRNSEAGCGTRSSKVAV